MTDPGPGPHSGPGPVVGDELIRHEERLRISTVREPVRTVRYSRRVVTETRMIPVEIRREILEVEDVEVPRRGGRHLGGSVDAAPAADLEIVLHEEVPVVNLEIRAVETVRVRVRSVASTVEVTEVLSAEQIAVEQGTPAAWVSEDGRSGDQVQSATGR